MILIINLNNIVEKELELENQGFRRTRRWIDDASQVGDEKLHQTKLNQVAIYKDNLNKIIRVSEDTPTQQVRNSFLERLSNLISTPHQPAARLSVYLKQSYRETQDFESETQMLNETVR